MNSCEHIDTLHARQSSAVTEHARRTGAFPFIDYAEKCATAMAGIESLAGLLRWNQCNDDFEEGPQTLTRRDIDNLLGLIQVAANALHEDAFTLNDWAQKHYVPEGER